jgi:hypothetical protein
VTLLSLLLASPVMVTLYVRSNGVLFSRTSCAIPERFVLTGGETSLPLRITLNPSSSFRVEAQIIARFVISIHPANNNKNDDKKQSIKVLNFVTTTA